MAANPIDLTVLANVKSWAQVTATTDDQTIQDCITSFSAYVLRLTGRGNADGSIPEDSPFNSQIAYDEFYDGSGTARLFLRNWPIVSVALLLIDGVQIPQSSSPTQAGWVVDGTAKSIALRNGAASVPLNQTLTVGFGTRLGHGYRFGEGIQNVEVQYTAGFDGTPEDLEMVARKVCALNYKRRDWIGQLSESMGAGGGTTRYGTWEMDNDCKRTILFYRRITA